MKRSVFWLMGILFSASLAITSCDETDGAVDPYHKWEERNQLFIDSIARVARANEGNEVGQWKVIHTYKFLPPLNSLTHEVNDYVYCRVLEKGEGTSHPLFTDAVKTNYRGKLIPLYDGSEFVFDQSYQGVLNDEVAVPVQFGAVVQHIGVAKHQDGSIAFVAINTDTVCLGIVQHPVIVTIKFGQLINTRLGRAGDGCANREIVAVCLHRFDAEKMFHLLPHISQVFSRCNIVGIVPLAHNEERDSTRCTG